MGELLQQLVGTRVRIYTSAASSSGTYFDEGTLVAYDYHWVLLRKDGDEDLLFPIYNIRLLKPV